MTTTGAEVLARAIPELGEARFAFVFGSYGKSAFGPDSDLDLAVDFGRRLSQAERLGLSGRLSAAVGRSVDLVDLRDADPIIAMQVLGKGRPFLVRDRHALAVFQMTTPSRYFDWKLCRRLVEATLWAAARS